MRNSGAQEVYVGRDPIPGCVPEPVGYSPYGYPPGGPELERPGMWPQAHTHPTVGGSTAGSAASGKPLFCYKPGLI